MYTISIASRCCEDAQHELYERGLAFAYARYFRVHATTIALYPDVLAVATHNHDVVGTMGLMYEHDAPHFFEQCDPPDAFERLAPDASRATLAEVSRFALTDTIGAHTGRLLAEALSAHLFNHGYACGIRHFGFVGKQSFRTFLEPLGITLVHLGKPTFANVPHSYIGSYLTAKNLACFGFVLTTTLQHSTLDDRTLQPV